MSQHAAVSKIPAVTLGFWIIKILATTLGETGGDTVSMTLHLGYLMGTAIFLTVLAMLVVAQVTAKGFHPLLYWATIVASTTAGTTMADFADRSLGIGYAGGSTLLFVCVMATLGLWYRSQGSVSVHTVRTPKVEAFYWATITFSQTLGTALGDWIADAGLGYMGGALVFSAALALVALSVFCLATLKRLLWVGDYQHWNNGLGTFLLCHRLSYINGVMAILGFGSLAAFLRKLKGQSFSPLA